MLCFLLCHALRNEDERKKNKKDKNKEKGKIYRIDLLGEVIICLE